MENLEHSGSFDKRISEYEFTPAMFKFMEERHNLHLQEIKSSLSDMSKELKSVAITVAKLPCDKHEGDRKVVETKVSAVESRVLTIENRPQDDRKLVFASMFGCGALGGLIVSGVMKLADIARIVIGGH